jgi:small neutral amino acid transporter SnatA (MarC family)
MRGPLARVWGAGLILVLILTAGFAVVAPPERCPPVDAAELRGSAQDAVDWFVRNQRADGTWLYLYDTDRNSVAPEYNLVRHAGAVMGLYRAAATGLAGALSSADRGTGWALDRLISRDGWSAFGTPAEIDTGATALLVAGLTIRREATGETRYDGLLRRLGRFLLAQTERSGAVLARYDPARGAPAPGEYSKYYTGEAYWALARLNRTFPGEGWGEAADRVGAYLATSRDDLENHWPPIADHWAAYGMADTVESRGGTEPLTEDELSYARRQAELFGGQTRWISERFGPWGALVRPGGVPRGGGYGVIGEGLTGWWQVANEDARLADLGAPIAERATCIAGLAVSAQSDRADAAGATRPDRVEGAWFRDGETRMDDQQHALAALLRTVPIVEATSGRPLGGGDDAPSAWLWLIALVAALNPARAAFGIPSSRGSPSALGLAALGGLIGGLAVCAAAALGGPLLEALDVSEPSFRIAAGTVAALCGIADLFRRPPEPEPALAGWRAALVPVAIPLVARPVLLVMALGAGADRSVLVAAGSMAIAVALLSGLTAWWSTDGPRGRVLRWASRLLAAVLIACGVVLGADGVLDV